MVSKLNLSFNKGDFCPENLFYDYASNYGENLLILTIIELLVIFTRIRLIESQVDIRFPCTSNYKPCCGLRTFNKYQYMHQISSSDFYVIDTDDSCRHSLS